MTRLLGHCTCTAKKKTRNSSVIQEAGGYHFTRVFLYVSLIGQALSFRKINLAFPEDNATPCGRLGGTF